MTTGREKVSFHSNPKGSNARECADYHTVALIPPAGKVILQSLQARLPQSMNQQIPVYKLCLKEAEEPTSIGSSKKQEDSRKTSTFASLTMLKPLTVWITTKLWKILKEMGVPDHITCLLRNLYAGLEATVRTGHGTTDWFQIGKGVR